MRDSGGQLVLHFDRLDGDHGVSRRAHRHILRRSSCTTGTLAARAAFLTRAPAAFPPTPRRSIARPALPAARDGTFVFPASPERFPSFATRETAPGDDFAAEPPSPRARLFCFRTVPRAWVLFAAPPPPPRASSSAAFAAAARTAATVFPGSREAPPPPPRVSPPPPRVSPSPEAISTSRARREIRAVTIQIPRAFEVRPSRGRPPRRDRSAPPCLTRTRIARKSVQSHRPRRSRASRSR